MKLRDERPIFVDIDGTLTHVPGRPWGPVIESRVEAVRALVRAGHVVVLWSGGGTSYAQAFARRHDLNVAAAVGKPSICVDDNSGISPGMRVRDPHWLDDVSS